MAPTTGCIRPTGRVRIETAKTRTHTSATTCCIQPTGRVRIETRQTGSRK